MPFLANAMIQSFEAFIDIASPHPVLSLDQLHTSIAVVAANPAAHNGGNTDAASESGRRL